MKKSLSLLTTTGITSVVIAGATVSTAFAWHPKGTIIKEVQDVTTSSAISDANTTSTALVVNAGDTLEYTVTVSNTGSPASNGDDDMASTIMTDSLPDGIVLTSNTAQRQITENLGTIKPGSSVTKQYEVKVTSQINGDIITNKACFTGNSIVNDNPQSGCDVAVIKVNVPQTPTPTPVPTQTPTPTPQATPTPPATLPNTGAGNIVVPAVVLMLAGYTTYLIRLKRRISQTK